MTDKLTTLEELLKIPFLESRLQEVRRSIATNPQGTTLWIGAGHSTNLLGLPTWRNFLLDCLEQVDKTASDYSVVKSVIEAGRLQLAAEYLYELLGERLFLRIRDIFGIDQTLSKQIFIPRFCISNIITTNYDSILESSMKYYELRTPLDSIESLLDSDFNLVKLHGNASNPASCVLTISSYAKAYNRDFEWYLLNTFMTNTVIFIGVSMDESEPFFKTISTIKKVDKLNKKHFAIVAVKSSSEGKILGDKLEKLGIYLIPFIPDSGFTIFDSILQYLSDYTFTKKELSERLDYLRGLIKRKKFIQVGAFLHNMCQDEWIITQNVEFGDVVNNFLTELLELRDAISSAIAYEYLRQFKEKGIDIPGIIRSVTEINHVKLSVLQGSKKAFERIEKITKDSHQIDLMKIKYRISKHIDSSL